MPLIAAEKRTIAIAGLQPDHDHDQEQVVPGLKLAVQASGWPPDRLMTMALSMPMLGLTAYIMNSR